MRAYFAIIRPKNILLTLLTQVVFMLAASRTNYLHIDWENIAIPESILVVLTCCLTAAGGYVINDLFDVDTDHVNRPNKRILKRDISHRAAMIYYIILTAAGQICGYSAGLGMGLFADGGRLASKPYAASGSYIRRMSTYCQGCRYDPKQRSGPKACPFNSLYWDFLARHRQELSRNPRMGLVLKQLDRIPVEELQAIRASAADHRQREGAGEDDSGSLST